MPAFVAPDTDAPLDTEACTRTNPKAAVIKGLYPGAIATAKRRGLSLPQIGLLEGACGVRREMRVSLDAPSKGEIECRWEASPASRPSVV